MVTIGYEGMKKFWVIKSKRERDLKQTKKEKKKRTTCFHEEEFDGNDLFELCVYRRHPFFKTLRTG